MSDEVTVKKVRGCGDNDWTPKNDDVRVLAAWISARAHKGVSRAYPHGRGIGLVPKYFHLLAEEILKVCPCAAHWSKPSPTSGGGA